MIDRIVIAATASGSAGAATATAYSNPVAGRVLKVHVDYRDDTDTTDVTLQDENDPASENIVNLENNDTDTTLHPRRVSELNDGTDITYDGTNEVYEPYVVHGRLKLSVAGADDADVVQVTVWLDT